MLTHVDLKLKKKHSENDLFAKFKHILFYNGLWFIMVKIGLNLYNLTSENKFINWSNKFLE